MFRRLLPAVALLALLIFSGSPVRAQSAATAQYFVAELVGRASLVIRDTSLSPFDRRERFRALVAQHFDVPEIARFVLGRHWQGASAEDRAEFTAAFADYLVAMYVPRIAAYGEPAFTVIGQRSDSGGTVTVSSSVARPQSEPMPVEWRTERVAGTYKILDVIIAGVSLMQLKRAEIGSVVDWSDGRFTRLLDGATTLIRCG